MANVHTVEHDGAIELLGRTVFQIEIHGFRVESSEVEAAMMASGLLKGAIVTLQEGPHGEKSLIAHVVPREPGLLERGALQAYLRAKLPPYMIPSRFHELDTVPLTATGRLDRAALAERTRANSEASRQAGASLEAGLAAIWCELLGVQSVVPEDDFFRLGGDSLLAARLMMRVLEAYAVCFPVYALYESGTLRTFIEVVRRAQCGLPITRWAEEGPAAWRLHARLPIDINVAEVPRTVAELPVGSPATARKIFMTGATGFLGTHLLRELLTQTGARVVCLVRASDEAEGRERLREAMRRFGVWDERFAPRVQAVPGNLRQLRLGLGPREHAALAEEADMIFHAAAQMSHVQPYSSHRAANVDGTAEVLRLATLGRTKPLHHVSTIAVFGPTGHFNGQRQIREEDDLGAHLECLRHDTGYAASRWVSEQMVWEAARRGLPVSVYRPGAIFGDSRSGVSHGGDFTARVLRGCIALGAYPQLPQYRQQLVSVDYVSAAIVRIAMRAGADGRPYHLVPPQPQDATTLPGLFELLAECGYPLPALPYPEWIEKLMRDEQVAQNPLCPLIPMLFERVQGERTTRWELHENMPEFDAHNAVEVLEDSGVDFRRLDRALLGRYLARWEQAGLIPAPQQR